MKLTKSIPIWLSWIAAVMFFAFASYWAPGYGSGGGFSAPEFFLFALGCIHIVLGLILISIVFCADNDF